MKDYAAIAAQLNKNYANLYRATASSHGVTVVLIRQCNVSYAALFLESVFKGKDLAIVPILDDGVVTIR